MNGVFKLIDGSSRHVLISSVMFESLGKLISSQGFLLLGILFCSFPISQMIISFSQQIYEFDVI